MRAVVLHAERDLRVEEREVPKPGRGEVLVRISNGGICGSDLHYYRHGGFGVIRVKEPMVLGHEIAGHVAALGEGVSGPETGRVVAVNPSSPCGDCAYCRAGQPIHCTDMRFLGSAMRTPHVQGGFADYIVCRAENAVALPEGTDPMLAAFAEPLAVCLHAVGEAPVYGARVLVAGAGPIGLLVMLAARHAGAREIVVTDVLDEPLALARQLGADRTINVGSDAAAFAEYEAGKGYFDVVFEAAGQGATIVAALKATRPRGTIVAVGQGAIAEVPITSIVTRELVLRGSFRFAGEFARAAELLAAGRIDVRPLLSKTMPVGDANQAFQLAADKSRAVKVQLSFA